MDSLSFTKMQGAGNDFVVIDNREQIFSNEDIIKLAPKLCNRRFGIGADGILALHTPDDPSLDYTMFYRNADGSDAGMCGNGARCLALYAARAGLGSHLAFNVHDTIYKAEVNSAKGCVTISFPMEVNLHKIDIDGEPAIYQLYTGTEHIVLETPESVFKDDEQLRARGKQLRNHTQFNPPGTNVNFIVGKTADAIRIKTFEKGVEDLTLACGTGAIAAALSWHHIQQADSSAGSIKVHADGGDLQVNFKYNDIPNGYYAISLSGGAQIVFEGTYTF